MVHTNTSLSTLFLKKFNSTELLDFMYLSLFFLFYFYYFSLYKATQDLTTLFYDRHDKSCNATFCEKNIKYLYLEVETVT